MLQQRQADLLFNMSDGFIIPRERSRGLSFSSHIFRTKATETLIRLDSPSDETDASLDEAARSEREYVRKRLREELKREPTEQELDEWLRQHTEGY